MGVQQSILAQQDLLVRQLKEFPEHRKRQARLQRLAELWMPKLTCMSRRRQQSNIAPTLEAINVVGGYVGDAKMDVRLIAMHALQCAGEHAQFAKQWILQGMHDDHPPVRMAALRVANNLRFLNVFQKEELQVCLGDSSWGVRMEAVKAMREMDCIEVLTRHLLENLPKQDYQPWVSAAQALGVKASGLYDALVQMTATAHAPDFVQGTIGSIINRLPACPHCRSKSNIVSTDLYYVCQRCSNRYWYNPD